MNTYRILQRELQKNYYKDVTSPLRKHKEKLEVTTRDP